MSTSSVCDKQPACTHTHTHPADNTHTHTHTSSLSSLPPPHFLSLSRSFFLSPSLSLSFFLSEGLHRKLLCCQALMRLPLSLNTNKVLCSRFAMHHGMQK